MVIRTTCKCLSLALLCAALVAGCIDKNSGGPQPRGTVPRVGTQTSAEDANSPARGGILRLPLSIDINDPALTALDLSDPRLWALARCLEVPLMRSRPDGSVAPGLASAHSSGAGGKTWVFELRNLPGNDDQPGYLGEHIIQRFKDILRGPATPLRAQLSALLAGGKDYASGRGTEIEGITLDESTLTINLSRPYQKFPLWLSQPGLGVLLSTELPAGGFGPFGLMEIDGNELVLSPNPDALDGPPLLDELRFVCLRDKREQVALFKAGGLDAANVYWEDAAAVAADSALSPRLVRHESAAMYLGVFDLHEGPWGDQQFQSKLGLRQSVNQILDVPLLAEAYGGQFKPWRHFIAPAFRDYVGAALEQQPAFINSPQVEEARYGQKAADHEQGNFLTPGAPLGYLNDGIVEDRLVTEVLRQWLEISVRMKPVPMPREELAQRVDSGKHEILLIQHRPAWPDVDAALYPLLHSELYGKGGNSFLLKDSGIDAALEAGQGAADGTARRKVYQNLCETLEKRALAVFIGHSTPGLLISPRIAGLSLTPCDYDASFQAQDFSRLGVQPE